MATSQQTDTTPCQGGGRYALVLTSTNLDTLRALAAAQSEAGLTAIPPRPLNKVRLLDTVEERREKTALRRRRYRKKPEVRAKMQAYNSRPEVVARRRAYAREPANLSRKSLLAKSRRALLSVAIEKDPTLQERYLPEVVERLHKKANEYDSESEYEADTE